MKQKSKIEKMKRNEKLREELLEMMKKDQRTLETYQKTLKAEDWEVHVEVRRRNTERMKKIIEEYSWPGISLVGEDGSNAAWLIAQHSDRDLEFQKQALELLEKVAEKGEASKKDLARLIDRVRLHLGKPQLFGTQFEKKKDGKWGPRPIENPEFLKERRKEIGLEPFSEYEKRMEELHKIDSK